MASDSASLVAIATSFYSDIIEVHLLEGASCTDRYKRLYRLLQSVAKELAGPANIQFPNLFARVRYLTDKFRMSSEQRALLHDLRVLGRDVVRGRRREVLEQEYAQALKGLCEAVAIFTGKEVPARIRSWFPQRIVRPDRPGKTGEFVPDLRVIVEDLLPQSREIICRPEEQDLGFPDALRVRYGVLTVNEEFVETAELLWPGAHLYLVSVGYEAGVYTPEFIVLEPDYLVNVTDIAECVQWKWENTDPRLHLVNKFSANESKPAMLLGNVANAFLDALVYEEPSVKATFQGQFKEVFKLYPFEFSTLFAGAEGNQQLQDFMRDAKAQFENLRQRIDSDVEEPPLWKERKKATIEPSFYSAKFGIQGRLDLLLNGAANRRPRTRIVELKGGQFPKPYGGSDPQPWSNHAAQARLYRLLVSDVGYLGDLKEGSIQPFILYSKDSTPKLLGVTAFKQEDRRIINLRNRLVAHEYAWLQARKPEQMLNLLRELDEADMPAGLASFITAKFSAFRKSLDAATPLERRYAAAWSNFIAAEHYLNRVGEPEAEESSSRGLAGLWRTSREEKESTSDILLRLTLQEACYAGSAPVAMLRFTRPEPAETTDGSTSFRVGDLCVLYPYDSEEQNVLDHQLFKGTIAQLTDREVVVKLRQPQTGRQWFTDYQEWALEADSTDKSITDMYRNVGAFLRSSDTFRRGIILGTDVPRTNALPSLTSDTTNARTPALSEEQQMLLRRMLAARDYFLLIGPPGTGKTSVMLKYLTRELFANPHEQILLLAYTNRAVDEICDALGGLDFIRIGSELGTEERHRRHLLDRQLESCATRDAVIARLAACRVFVGTLASLQGKPLLFQLKTFTTAVIDEASQILEPQLIGLLTQVGRFLLIGDHKQLPAITVQPPERSRLAAPEPLHAIGLVDRRVSFFERILGRCKKEGWNNAWGLLSAQGRMHEVLAKFPNHAFYGNQLTLAGLEHQRGELPFATTYVGQNVLEQLLSRQRLVYIPSYPTARQQSAGGGQRRHEEEARLIALLTKTIQQLYQQTGRTFDPAKTVGVITPYRNQVATIKREMERHGVSDYQDITVDTVERYQGSQRDIILVSFCLNSVGQLRRMASLMDEEDVDRKLNVLLTRARHQMVLLGAESIMAQDRRYFRLVEFIKTRGGYVAEGVNEVLAGRCRWQPADPAQPLAGRVYSPDSALTAFFDTQVVDPLRRDARTQDYPKRLLGYDADFNRNVLLNFGRADFDEPVTLPTGVHFSPGDRVNVYCYFNMRKHFFSSLALFESNSSLLRSYHRSAVHPEVLMLDFGCGPFTAGLALAHSKVLHSDSGPAISTRVHYVGIDRSEAMKDKAQHLAGACPIASRWTHEFHSSWSELNLVQHLEKPAHLVLLNFSYFFASDSLEPGELADWVSTLIERFPLHRYVLVVQNTPAQHRNSNYYSFRHLLRPSLRPVASNTETVSYVNQEHSRYDKSETVFYELLATA